jgi:toxin ParE1/3/4
MSQPRHEWELAPEAVEDLAEVIEWTQREFGEDATSRYEALLLQALMDLADDPWRPGSRARTEVDAGELYSYPLSSSRRRSRGAKVHRPRHLLLYRIKPGLVRILRILHDSRDVGRHLPDAFRSEE